MAYLNFILDNSGFLEYQNLDKVTSPFQWVGRSRNIEQMSLFLYVTISFHSKMWFLGSYLPTFMPDVTLFTRFFIDGFP